MKRLGPELKMPNLKGRKAPPLLTDLYQDLRDRRLLPLVALIVVAILATPFLLGGGEDVEEDPAAPPVAGASSGGEAPHLTVVEAHPGLRDPRKRLAARQPTDPFIQRYTGSVRNGGLPHEESVAGGGEEAGAPVPGGTATPEATPLPEGSSSGGGGSSPGAEAGGDDPLPSGERISTFSVDVQISRTEEQPDGRMKMGEPKVSKAVRPPQPLPGDKAPVITYLGVNFEKRNPAALLMVSRDVTAVFGDAKCVSGTEHCELLELEPGFPEIFEFGPNHVRYKVKVLEIDLVYEGNT
jgi:hypothetical protein